MRTLAEMKDYDEVPQGEASKELPPETGRNPLGMTQKVVLQGLIDGWLKTGPPPAKKKCRSDKWKKGLQFLYFADDDEVLENWFICTKCAITYNCCLEGGTRALNDHIKNYKDDEYRFSKAELCALLNLATQVGVKNGELTAIDLENMLPSPEFW